MIRTKLTSWLLLIGLAFGSNLNAQTSGNYVIGPKDILTITVIEDQTLSGKYTVESDGMFSMPLIGPVRASGLTVRQFEAALKKLLQDGSYIRNPQVTVGVDQYNSQRIIMMGEVRVPGVQGLTGGMTLLEALVRAGGTLPSASGDVMVVRRRGDGKDPETIRVEMKSLESGSQQHNIELRNGDTIIVDRAGTVYVFGQVKSPNAYPVVSGTTLLQALALAGGATEDAALGRIKILRVEPGQAKPKEIKNAKLTEIVRPGDTIIVPTKYF